MATKAPPASSAATGKPRAGTPKLDALLAEEPDLVDRIFDYILSQPAMAAAAQQIAGDARSESMERLKQSVRKEFHGERGQISARHGMRSRVLALFNGRNAAEVARVLHISRASVYRYIKQPGGR